MTEYGPDFFRNYLDRLDEKISYPDPRDTNIMDRIPPEVQQQMQKNMEKRSQSGLVPFTSPADAERRAKPNPKQQELWHKWGAMKCGMSQNYDRKTGRCVDAYIDPENFRPPEDVTPNTLPEPTNPSDSIYHDPIGGDNYWRCPARSQTWDPKTRRCVPDTDLPIINIIDPMKRGRK
jgi:hypothetical protein